MEWFHKKDTLLLNTIEYEVAFFWNYLIGITLLLNINGKCHNCLPNLIQIDMCKGHLNSTWPNIDLLWPNHTQPNPEIDVIQVLK